MVTFRKLYNNDQYKTALFKPQVCDIQSSFCLCYVNACHGHMQSSVWLSPHLTNRERKLSVDNSTWTASETVQMTGTLLPWCVDATSTCPTLFKDHLHAFTKFSFNSPSLKLLSRTETAGQYQQHCRNCYHCPGQLSQHSDWLRAAPLTATPPA